MNIFVNEKVRLSLYSKRYQRYQTEENDRKRESNPKLIGT